MAKKIETKTRTYDEGLSVIKEVTKIITHEDGRVETNVTTFEVGKRTHHSDYWRAKYADQDIELPSEQEAKERYLLEKCIHDVARIANAFDDDIKLGYKNPENPSNNPLEKTVLLDPRTAISEGELGEKVDVFSGEILLGTALRKQSEKTRAAYCYHLKQAYDESLPMADRGASILYLAMEADAACQYIKKEAPGFVEYAYARARKYVSQKSSSLLQDAFLEKADSGHKFAALVREFDTFGSQPLEYGSFSNSLKNIMSQVRNLPDAETRLDAARQLAHRFLVQGEGKIELPDMPGEDDPPPDSQGQKMKLIQEMLSSADMMGKPSDMEVEEFNSPATGSGLDKPKSPSEILKEHLFDGNVQRIPTRLETEVKVHLSEVNAKKLYNADVQDVKEVSEAIEESLEILNKEQECWDEYSLRNGEIDEGSFYKLIDNSDDVFYRVETLPKMRIQISLLLDESGSMCSVVSDSDGNVSIDQARAAALGQNWHLNRCAVARKLATAFVEGTKNNIGVDLSVFGHAAPDQKVCRVYKYLDKNTPESDFYRVAHITDRLYNFDGYAILKAGECMLEDDEEYDRRIMFIISDGEPSASHYRGVEAQKHIASVVKYLNESGVDTYAIGVDNAFPPDQGQKMYGENKVIVLPNFNLREVSAIISAFLEEIAKGN